MAPRAEQVAKEACLADTAASPADRLQNRHKRYAQVTTIWPKKMGFAALGNQYRLRALDDLQVAWVVGVGYSLEMLPGWERARRYRELAAEVSGLAEAARFPEIRASYLSLATSWVALADELEGRDRDMEPRAKPPFELGGASALG